MRGLCHLLAAAILVVAFAALPVFGTTSAGEPRSPQWLLPASLSSPPPPARARRIVSLAPVVTETLFLVGAGDRVVGVTRFCDRPAEAQRLPKIGGYTDPSLEAILTLSPDLVVAMPSFGGRAVLERLRATGVPVLVVFADTLPEVRGLVGALADVAGRPAAGHAILRGMDDGLARAAALRTGRPRLRAAVVVGLDPIVLAGPGTFADDALARVGLASIVPVASPQWPTWSIEALMAARADVLIAAEGPDVAARLRGLLERVPPERRPRVFAADRPLLMRPGPSLADDVLALAKLVSTLDGAPGETR
jgi:iron complex transport system substrate-binding protein